MSLILTIMSSVVAVSPLCVSAPASVERALGPGWQATLERRLRRPITLDDGCTGERLVMTSDGVSLRVTLFAPSVDRQFVVPPTRPAESFALLVATMVSGVDAPATADLTPLEAPAPETAPPKKSWSVALWPKVGAGPRITQGSVTMALLAGVGADLGGDHWGGVAEVLFDTRAFKTSSNDDTVSVAHNSIQFALQARFRPLQYLVLSAGMTFDAHLDALTLTPTTTGVSKSTTISAVSAFPFDVGPVVSIGARLPTKLGVVTFETRGEWGLMPQVSNVYGNSGSQSSAIRFLIGFQL